MKRYPYFLLVLALLVACKKSPPVDKGTPRTSNEYRNPVFEPILADPTVIRADDGWFYAYGTSDDWGDGNGTHQVPIVRSKNLTKWEFVSDAFKIRPIWKDKGGIWAPDIALVNGKYYLYYAFSIWADPNPGIGLAIADSPAGPFTDVGKLFLSEEVGVPNSIDPYYFEAEGKKYLFWGSYSNASSQGTYGVELSADGKSVPDLTKKFKVAAGDFEAVTIQKKGEYYYFIGSKGGCCDGASSTYQLRVGRAQDFRGPYLDQNGKDLKERGAGTLLVHGNATYAGLGHNSRFFTDDVGTDWLLYHAILKNNPKVPSGANRRILMLDKLNWVNGWPEIANAEPGSATMQGPEFR